jgi:RNA polymerase sigma-70 factor (ECF subfamily)
VKNFKNGAAQDERTAGRQAGTTSTLAGWSYKCSKPYGALPRLAAVAHQAGHPSVLWHNSDEKRWLNEMSSDDQSGEAPARRIDPSHWVAAHGDVLYRFALMRVGDPSVAEELVQETFLAALRGRHGFHAQSTERTWLIGILKHKLVDYLRQSKREIPTEAIDVEVDAYFNAQGGWASPPSLLENPVNNAEQEELRAQLAECLQQLPERLSRAFVLTQVDGLVATEACKVLDVTPTNLWVMLHRSRLRLRQCLERAGFGQRG